MSTANAVAREASWLARSGDGLPSLLKDAGGPWTAINAYWPRTPQYRQSTIYVMRSRLRDIRVSNQRKRPEYTFRLKMIWPIGSTTTAANIAETEQANFDYAIDLVIERVRGTVGDKTHGGAFLSVGETPGPNPDIVVEYEMPESTVSSAYLCATMSYAADDFEVAI